MSPYKSVYAPSSKKRKASKVKNSFFNLFTRKHSDGIRKGILGILGYSMVDGDNEKFFRSLPEPKYREQQELSQEFLNLIQARALFSKDEDVKSSVDREQVAFSSFLESEERCRQVNDSFRRSEFTKGDVSNILFYSMRKISQILGEAPSLAEIDFLFGPGESTSCKIKTNPRNKLSSRPSISKASLPILKELKDTLPHFHPSINDVEDAEVSFVPKNLDTYRSICVEPTVSGMMQRGIGSLLKKKLLYAGIDLRDQTINQKRSMLGSRNGSYSTIDLKSASDSLATLLVMELLPIDWYMLLDSCRSREVLYKGNRILLEKFSSMGNGYTFELESLIFYALGFGIARHFNLHFDLTVYGDDIVTTPDIADRIVEIFPLIGLIVNQSKSFLSGPFRESCGADYFLGVNIRPCYVRDRLSYASLVRMYNFFVRRSIFDPNKDIRKFILSHIPAEFQLWGPDGYGDGHLISGDLASCLKPYRRKDGWGGYTFETFVRVPSRESEEPIFGDSLLPAYTAGRDPVDLDVERWKHRSMSEYVGTILDLSSISHDHYIVRTPRGAYKEGRQVRVYILGL